MRSHLSYILPDQAVHYASSSDRADRIEISFKMVSQLLAPQTTPIYPMQLTELKYVLKWR